jgi:hypothetical protein
VRPPFPSAVESREAERLGAQYELIGWAALRIHCVVCNGALLAAITWVRGSPLAAAREQGARLVPREDPAAALAVLVD